MGLVLYSAKTFGANFISVLSHIWTLIPCPAGVDSCPDFNAIGKCKEAIHVMQSGTAFISFQLYHTQRVQHKTNKQIKLLFIKNSSFQAFQGSAIDLGHSSGLLSVSGPEDNPRSTFFQILKEFPHHPPTPQRVFSFANSKAQHLSTQMNNEGISLTKKETNEETELSADDIPILDTSKTGS